MQLRFYLSRATLPLLLTAFICIDYTIASADTVILGASKDNTLINSAAGAISNATGPLFAGKTGGAGPGALRAILAFDLASEIPQGATITNVDLTMTVLQAGGGSSNDAYTLHRVEQDWGEGTSNADGGAGAPSTTNDATWIHTFFDTNSWINPGGDFASSPSATESVGGTGPVTWGSTPDLVSDVQTWLDDPTANYGWILIGNEIRNGSARQFAARESSSSAPQLAISFFAVPEPSSLIIAICCSMGCLALRRRRTH